MDGLFFNPEILVCDWMANNAGCVDRQLFATCDNEMKVYFDGVLQPETAGMRDWTVTSYLNIPANTRVLAIECKNLRGGEGILASTTTGLKTDSSWLCSRIQVGGWYLPNFVPTSDFDSPNREGTNSVAPWGGRLAHFFSCPGRSIPILGCGGFLTVLDPRNDI